MTGLNNEVVSYKFEFSDSQSTFGFIWKKLLNFR